MRRMVLMVMLAGLWGCGPKMVQPEGPRPAIGAEAVELYQKEPGHYEDLGLIAVEADLTRERMHDAEAVGNALREAAAARGANGVLLIVPPGEGFYRVGAYYRGQYYTFPSRLHPEKAVVGRAIHVAGH